MVQASIAASFWAAVEDCLVEFHAQSRGAAAEKVVALWKRLAEIESTARKDEPSYSDMIYHAEPWYIACNLAENPDLPLDSEKEGPYTAILKQNHLA
ncbi:hypothetical protein SBA4_3190004 [Candidatus Sulfopaludibacter sp. SbA4]|nr:hypothetical protein SBA4_3190004 [Candidatus Sulfopaludibacter sp. SbA4]